jgi:hypothetical protein
LYRTDHLLGRDDPLRLIKVAVEGEPDGKIPCSEWPTVAIPPERLRLVHQSSVVEDQEVVDAIPSLDRRKLRSFDEHLLAVVQGSGESDRCNVGEAEPAKFRFSLPILWLRQAFTVAQAWMCHMPPLVTSRVNAHSNA